MKGNVLTYTYNFFDEVYTRIAATAPLSAGKHEVKVHYVKAEGDAAEVTLAVDGARVGSGSIPKVELSKFSISEPFDVGVDNGGAVDRRSYKGPFRFSDTLDFVRFDLE